MNTLNRKVVLLNVVVAVCLRAGLVRAVTAEEPFYSVKDSQLAVVDKFEHGSSPTAQPMASAEGPSRDAIAIFQVFGFPITNSMIVTWFVALSLIIVAQLATRHMDSVPTGLQNFWEWLVEGLYDFLEQIVGRHLVERTFWFFATIFIFILAANWAGLIPGVGTIGWGHQTAEGFRIDKPLFRGATSDLNLTLAMALVFFACWFVWANQELGPLGCLKELFGPKGESAGLIRVVMAIMFFLVGCLNIISILFRPISLSLRLYGNAFAGENMLDTMAELFPGLGWLLPIPFYFMELLVGLVQASVFMLLTAVFVLLACPQKEEAPAEAQK